MDDAGAGPKWPLQHTIQNIQQNCVDRFDLEGEEGFTVFGCCVFGVCSAYWDDVLQEVDGRTNEDHIKALTLYLEKVAGVQDLQDSILRWVGK